MDWGNIIGAGAGLLGSYLSGQSSANADSASAAQLAAMAQQSKFKPFGVTNSFGQSGFQYDGSGNLTGAGYQLAPGVQNQLNSLFSGSNGMLDQTLGAQQATAPLSTGAQSAMNLGQQYLGANPDEQAQKWMTDQQNLLSSSRGDQLSNIRANLNATGRTGLAIGGNGGMQASNPEMQAYYNAIAQQDRDLASRATTEGMNYAKFGAGMMGSGADMLNSMYGAQTNAFNPYNSAISTSEGLDKLGRNTMDMSTALGSATSTAAANAAKYAQAGAQYTNSANSYSPWGGLLSGIGSAASSWGK
jgi:hypothetical protein